MKKLLTLKEKMKNNVIFSLSIAFIVVIVYGLLHEFTTWLPNSYKVLWLREWPEYKFINLPELTFTAQTIIIFFSVLLSIRLIRLMKIDLDQKLIREFWDLAILPIMFMSAVIIGASLGDNSYS